MPTPAEALVKFFWGLGKIIGFGGENRLYREIGLGNIPCVGSEGGCFVQIACRIH